MTLMPILGPPSAHREVVMSNVVSGPVFRNEMFPALWDTALEFGIDPVGMVAQSGKETAWGAFTGDTIVENHNTAGIKWHPRMVTLLEAQGIKPDQHHPLASTLYFTAENFELGARVHAEHLLAWCGVILPDPLDPRFKAVMSVLPSKGPAVTWADLGTRWAPAADYGERIEEIMRRLRGDIPVGDQ